MTFRVEIELGNDAMQTAADLSLALKGVAEDLTEAELEGRDLSTVHNVIRDANGNRVGVFNCS